MPKAGPFPWWERSRGITRNSQIGVRGRSWRGGGHPRGQSLPVLHGEERRCRRTAREARAEESRGAGTGACGIFGGWPGACPYPERVQRVLRVGTGDLAGTGGPRRGCWGDIAPLGEGRYQPHAAVPSPSATSARSLSPPCQRRGWAAPWPVSTQPLPADVLGRKRTGPLLRGCSGEVSVPVPSSPRRLAARKGRWGMARGGSRRGAEEQSEETPGVRRTWGGEVEAGPVPGVERSVRRESRDTESQEGRES